MRNKCEKYEFLFVFGNEESLNRHIENCPDCKEEHEKMLKVSSLVKEAAPFIKQTKKRNVVIQSICATFLLFVMLGGVGVYHTNYSELLASGIYENDISVISQMGFPTDEYGLLLVE